MKKILLFICTISIGIFITACGNRNVEQDKGEEYNEKKDEKIKIVSTIFPYYDFSREIGKDVADISMLLKPGVETHDYDPTPKDIKDIQNADLFIYTGGENDVWIDDILTSMDKKPKVLRVLDYVTVLNEELVEGMEHSHEDEHHHNDDDSHNDENDNIDEEIKHNSRHEDIGKSDEIDEHIWTSPLNAIIIVEKITNIMEELDNENKEIYIQNSNEYIKQLEEIDKMYRNIVSSAKRKTIIFGDRFPFRYLADEYDIDYYAPFSGCSTETEASASTVAFLIDKAKEGKIPVVFNIELSNGKIADAIAEASNAKRLELHSVHNLSKDEFERGENYISIMKKNAQNLKEALN